MLFVPWRTAGAGGAGGFGLAGRLRDEAARHHAPRGVTSTVRRVLLRGEDFDDPPPPFRTGSAGLIRLDAEGEFELEERMRISANSLHALVGHGVVDQLNELPLEGTLGEGAPSLIRPALVEAARRVFYDADATSYGGAWEFLVHHDTGPPATEYRVAVVNREYQLTLVRLIDILYGAGRRGEGVWLAL